VVEKARTACFNSGQRMEDHFVEINEMIEIGKGGRRSIKTVMLAMGSTELAANLFRATQTEEKLRRENVRAKEVANRIHNEVGRKVRKTIHELGGTMPENLPVAESIKKVESREKKRLKAEQKKPVENAPDVQT
jgi:DNA-damage-inducible protein D